MDQNGKETKRTLVNYNSFKNQEIRGNHFGFRCSKTGAGTPPVC